MYLNVQMMMHLKEAFEMSSLEMEETQSNIFAKFVTRNFITNWRKSPDYSNPLPLMFKAGNTSDRNCQ